MKMLILRKTLCILCFLSVALFASAQQEITFLHTGDTHSQIEPFSTSHYSNVGGAGRRYAFICEERTKTNHLFLFDTGDFLVGTPYFNFFKGEVEIQLMNKMGYDAVLLGNHEFDNGCDALANLLKQAEFPIICSNYLFLNKKLKRFVKPYVTFTVGECKIGVFGLSPDLTYLTNVSEVKKNVIYNDPVEIARKMVAILKEKEHCQFIVCLSHLGYTGVSSDEVADTTIANCVDGIDVIFGGHSHTVLENPVIINHVPICHSGSRGAYIEKMKIKIPINNELNHLKN